jgi:hypothetical protein
MKEKKRDLKTNRKNEINITKIMLLIHVLCKRNTKRKTKNNPLRKSGRNKSTKR